MSDNPEQVSPDNQQDDLHMQDIHPEDHFPGHYKDNIEIPISKFLTCIVTSITTKTAWLNVIVMLTILIQVTLRYGFHAGEAWVDELIWHFYAFFMFGSFICYNNRCPYQSRYSAYEIFKKGTTHCRSAGYYSSDIPVYIHYS